MSQSGVTRAEGGERAERAERDVRNETAGAGHLSAQIATALETGAFDPQHAGELFLRTDAEKAIKGALGEPARLVVAARDEGAVRSERFLGAHFTPDLVVESGGLQVAVCITLLRSDAGPVTTALATALVLSRRYSAVVVLLLDRRLAKRNPFDEPSDEPAQRTLSAADQALIQRLAERHHIRFVVRHQDPFGW